MHRNIEAINFLIQILSFGTNVGPGALQIYLDHFEKSRAPFSFISIIMEPLITNILMKGYTMYENLGMWRFHNNIVNILQTYSGNIVDFQSKY